MEATVKLQFREMTSRAAICLSVVFEREKEPKNERAHSTGVPACVDDSVTPVLFFLSVCRELQARGYTVSGES